MMNFRFKLLAGSALLACALPSMAQADEAADRDIVVVASGVAQDADTVGQAITVVDREEIEQRQTVSVADLLATTPGVTLARNGGPGGVTSLFVRGANSDQLLVLIDGVRVNDVASPTGAYDFGNIQTGSIERIEVLRGANSVIWGSQALGGVVNIITPGATASPGFSATANGEYGDFETGEAAGTLSYVAGPVRASVGGAWFSTAGISARNTDPDRDKNDQYQLNGRLDVTLTEGVAVDLRGFQSRSYVEVDDFNDSSVTHQTNGYAGLRGSFLDGVLNLRASYSISSNRRDYDGAFGASRFTGRSERVALQGDWRINAMATLIAGAEEEWQEANGTFLSEAQNSHIRSVYGQLQLMPLDGLTVSGGVRHDDHREFGGNTSLGGNMAWRIGSTLLRASYAEGFKAPALDQLFNSGYFAPYLQPERSRNIDLGIEQSFLSDRVTARVTYFDRITRNQAEFFSCSTAPNPLCDRPGTYAYYLSVDRASADGVEAELSVRPAADLVLSTNYSFVNARDRSGQYAGLQLRRRPRQSLNSAIDWTPGRFGLGATVRVVSDSFDDFDNRIRLDGYTLVDLRASVAISDQLSLYGRIENLFDEDYVTAATFNSFGRAAYVGVRARL